MNDQPSVAEILLEHLNRGMMHILPAPKNGDKAKGPRIKVRVPTDALDTWLVIHQCRSCALLSAIEEGNKVPCPYCEGELMVFDPIPGTDFKGWGYERKEEEK